jgi:carboxyl-terminal processing protease
MPLVILIDGDTASASEIVASALQDRRRALLVGEESFGKGLVQTIYSLRAGTGLTLTTAKYYTPNGRSIQRPYNGVDLYDYFYSRYELGDKKRAKNAEGKPVERHRAGGVKPDIEVKLTAHDIKVRDACFEFTRLLVAGAISGLEEYQVKQPQYEYRIKGNEFPIDEKLLSAFRAFLRDHPELQLGDAGVARNLEYIRLRIRTELVTAAYGMEVAEQFLLRGDEQTMRAIEEVPRARQLRDQAKLFSESSERQ